MTLDRAGFAARRDVSRETLDRFDIYAGLLRKWSSRINLVSAASLADVWARHFLDSLQLLELAPEAASTWCDLGSGGGFPGLVVAIAAQEDRPNLAMTLIESDKRKAAFLRTVIRETGIRATVLAERIEAAPTQAADVVSARALAPLTPLLGLAARHLGRNGSGLFPKGIRHAAEIQEALEVWSFDCETSPSQTEQDAVILRISELCRA